MGLAHTAPVPDAVALARAAEGLNAGERVAILVGVRALGASEEVAQAADRLCAGVAKALLGKAVLPNHLPWVTGPIGRLGTEASDALMQDCDTLLMVVRAHLTPSTFPSPSPARGVQIDCDAAMLGLGYAIEGNLLGDAAATLRAAAPQGRPRVAHPRRGERRRLAPQDRGEGAGPADPIDPQRILHELSLRLPHGSVVTWDSGTTAAWWARN